MMVFFKIWPEDHNFAGSGALTIWIANPPSAADMTLIDKKLCSGLACTNLILDGSGAAGGLGHDTIIMTAKQIFLRENQEPERDSRES
jgi:hypothetical protein